MPRVHSIRFSKISTVSSQDYIESNLRTTLCTGGLRKAFPEIFCIPEKPTSFTVHISRRPFKGSREFYINKYNFTHCGLSLAFNCDSHKKLLARLFSLPEEHFEGRFYAAINVNATEKKL